MSQPKLYSKAEIRKMRELAVAANTAIEAHRSFVEFLREQHEAPESEGWQMGALGFEKGKPEDEPSVDGEQLNPTSNGE